jgi:hypothetical protein
MRLLYDGYITQFVEKSKDWKKNVRENYKNIPYHLVISATEIHQGEIITIDDEDFCEALLDAFEKARNSGMTNEAARDRAIEVAAEYMTVALMASGSLDEINGFTEVKQIPGMSVKERHKGQYLDGAWAENPPIKELIDYNVDEIWMVEIFPKLCLSDPETYEAREDRKEELSQNALVEQQLYFIRKLNLWLESGRLVNTSGDLNTLRRDLVTRLKKGDHQLREAFNHAVAHPQDYSDPEAVADHITQKYRPITTRCIELPASLQPLTAGARIVNTRSFLIDKMKIGYENAKRFVRTLP